jgi:hypothetical protein
LPEVVESFLQVYNEVAALSRFYDNVVDLDLPVVPYLPFEAELHTLLVCSPCVLQSERHFHIAETIEGGDEHGGRLVHLSKGYLVIN